jgi:hypothetical protein
MLRRRSHGACVPESLHAFDRIDAEIRFQAHLRGQRFDRIAGFIGYHFQQNSV